MAVASNGYVTLTKDLAPGPWYWRVASDQQPGDHAVWYFVVRSGRGHAAPALRGIDIDGDAFADLVLGGGLFRGSRMPLSSFAPIKVALCDGPAALQGSVNGCHDWSAIRPMMDVDQDGFGDAQMNGIILRGGPNGFRPEGEAIPCHVDAPCNGTPVGDTNGDGYLDILLNKSVRLGSAHGFEGRMDSDAFPTAEDIHAAGDVDHDGYDDLLVVDQGVRALSLLRGGANGFVSGGTLPLPSSGSGDEGIHVDVIAGDVNGDGTPDVAVLTVTPKARGRDVAVAVYLGAPGMNLSHAAVRRLAWMEPSLGKPSYHGLAAGDVDGDGYDDLIVGLESPKNDLRVVRGGADSLRLDPPRGPVLEQDGSVTSVSTVGDVDGNGCDDVLVVGASAADPGATDAHLFLGGASGLSPSPLVLTQSRWDRVPQISKK